MDFYYQSIMVTQYINYMQTEHKWLINDYKTDYTRRLNLNGLHNNN